jgi:hypothetical protein
MMYQLTTSNTILNNKNTFVEECYGVKERLDYLGIQDTTWDYSKYNIFTQTSGSELFWNLYKEICVDVRKYAGGGPLWMQAWMNFHKSDQVLDWHNHEWEFHGYVSIDPKNSKTVFENWEVQNKIGNIYIGPGHHKHKVEVLEPYDDYRITIGLDFYREPIPCNNILIPVY